jgi:uncharacterized membrane protein
MPSDHRNLSLDLIRTLAIVLMVVFHFIYDLKYFGYHSWDIPDGAAWNAFRNVIVGLFMVCVGVGLAIAHGRGLQRRPFFRRLARVAGGAAVVTTMSIFMFPKAWIYFGVLHFIVVASAVSLPMAGRPRLAGLLGATMVGVYWAGWPTYGWPIYYLNEWLPNYSSDFVSPSPWFGVVWLGIALGHSRWFRRDPLRAMPMAVRLGAPGRHSLLIYLLHQPIMFGLFWLIES